MGLINRVLLVVARYAQQQRGATVLEVGDDGIGVTTGDERVVVAWGEIDRIVAMVETPLSSNTLALVFEFAGTRRLVVADSSLGWCSLLSELARRLPRAVPAASWQLQLMAEPASRVEVYHRR